MGLKGRLQVEACFLALFPLAIVSTVSCGLFEAITNHESWKSVFVQGRVRLFEVDERSESGANVPLAIRR